MSETPLKNTAISRQLSALGVKRFSAAPQLRDQPRPAT
jgi:hypothetical protein